MGMDVRLTLDDTLPVRLAAAITKGLVAGGEIIRAASVALAPKEDEPRHGIHMVETAFVRPEAGGGVDQVAVGYTAFWAAWQEMKDEYHHTHGQAHFHETAFLTAGDASLTRVAEVIGKEMDP